MGPRARAPGSSSSGRRRRTATAGPVRSACRSSTPSGRRWSTTTCWWPCTPRTAGTSAMPTTGRATTPRCSRSSPRRSGCSRPGGPVEDAASALDLPRRPVPLPRPQGGGRSRTAAAGSRRSWSRLADIYKKMPQDFAENPVDVFKRNIYISPFWEEDLGALAELIGVEHVLFGSDYPHPEGLADPVELRRRAQGPRRRVRPQDHGRQPRAPDERRRGSRSMTARRGWPVADHPGAPRYGRRQVRAAPGRRGRPDPAQLCRAASRRPGRSGPPWWPPAIEPGDRVADLGLQQCRMDRRRAGPVPGRRRPGPRQHPLQGRRGGRHPVPEPGPGAGHRHRLPRHRLRRHAARQRRRAPAPRDDRRGRAARPPDGDRVLGRVPRPGHRRGAGRGRPAPRAPGARRPLGHPLHLGDDGAAQGRGHDPRPDPAGRHRLGGHDRAVPRTTATSWSTRTSTCSG